jgi:type II secretory pathway pseudopilin PulG
MKSLGNSRGQVLTSTIVTALVVVLIAAGLMRLVLMRYTAANEVTVQLKSARCVQLAVAQFFSTWDRLTSSGSGVTDPVCSSVSSLFKCTGSTHGHCRCNCTFTSGSLNGLTVKVRNGPNPPNPPCTFEVETNNASLPVACQ